MPPSRMDDALWARVSAVLDRVLDAEPADRDAALSAACHGDPDLEARARALLERAGEAAFLDSDVVRFAGPAFREELGGDALTPGGRIGAYRILRRLAVGGMSLVYLVQRDDDHFRRECVLKILDETALDPDEALRRFQAERQILATLDHPNIASVFDAGQTDDGRPFLILEYVDGEPVTAWCARRKTPLVERLELFRTVCEAVEYAHRRFIVHRDLKPGNIFVREDGTVKLLDFGIAKLVDATGSGESPMTRTGHRLLTPEYAAPEQVRGQEITTATDVYSLGVLLYELLVGHRPYTIADRSPAEMERIVCEDIPPLPSSRRRRAETPDAAPAPEAPTRRLRGDLDTIVMTALAKEPGRRYSSPGALADDIGCFLRGEAIVARSATPLERGARFLRKHRLAVFAAAAVVAFGIFHTVQVTVERNHARREAARAAQVSAFLQELFEVSDPNVSRGETITARDLLDRAVPRIRGELAGQPALQAEMLTVLAGVYLRLGLIDPALRLAEDAAGLARTTFGPDDAATADALDILGFARLEAGRYSEAERHFEAALRIRRAENGDRSPQVALLLHRLGICALNQNFYDRADSLLAAALDRYRAAPSGHEVAMAGVIKDLGMVRTAEGDLPGAEPLLRDALELRRLHLGNDHTAVYSAMANLGDNLALQGRYDEGVPLLVEAAAGLERLLGPDHSDVAEALNILGIARIQQGSFDEAGPPLKRALAIRRRLHGENHPDVARSLNDLGTLHLHREDYWSGEPVLRQSVAAHRALLGEENIAVGIGLTNLATALRGLGQWEEARRRFEEAVAIYRILDGDEGPRTTAARFGVATVLHEQGDLGAAEELYRDMMPLYRRLHPNGGRRLADFLLAYGRLLTRTDRAALALPYLEEAERHYGKAMGDRAVPTAKARVALAACLVALSEHARADSFLVAGLAIEERALDPAHPLLRQSRELAARHYEAWGRPADAARYRGRAPAP